MTLASLARILTGIPGFQNRVAYRAFPENQAPELPFIVYIATASDNFTADNLVYFPQQSVDVELYTEHKDEATEAAVESALNAAEIVWSKDEDYIDSEACYMIVYSITI